MTATLHAPQRPARTPLPTRQRRPGWTALAVALILGFAALGAFLYVRAGAKTPVVVVVADVPAGHVLKRTDVSTVAVAGGVTAVAGERLDAVVGQTATVHLLPNMLLQRSMISAQPGLSAAQAAVGVVVKSGQIPADGLTAGDTVAVVALPPAVTSAGSARAEVIVASALVDAFRQDPAQTGGSLLTLIVPRESATAVAAASGAGKIALVEVAPR
jgi:hypothetical protein